MYLVMNCGFEKNRFPEEPSYIVNEQLCIGIVVITQLYLQLYMTYQLYVSAISNLAIIRLDTIIRETV